MAKRQIRISDTHFNELGGLSDDLGLKKSEIIGLAISMLKSLRKYRAKKIVITTDTDKEIEVMIPVDINA